MLSNLSTTYSVPTLANVHQMAKNYLHNRFVIIDPKSNQAYWFEHNNDNNTQEINLLHSLRPHDYQDADLSDYLPAQRAELGGLIYSDEYHEPENVIPFIQ